MTEPLEPTAAADPGRPGPAPGVPRWLKVSAAVAALAILALVVAMLVLGGDHGPSRHTTSHQERPAQTGCAERADCPW